METSRAENSIRAKFDRSFMGRPQIKTKEQTTMHRKTVQWYRGAKPRRKLQQKNPPYKKSKIWDWRGNEGTHKMMIAEVSNAIVHVVRYGPA